MTEKRLGQGSFGTVHLMSDETVDKRIKLQTDHHRDAFMREVQLMQAVTPHPNIVQYINHSIVETQHDGMVGILTMAFAPGLTVAQWVADHAESDLVRHELWAPFTQTLLLAINYLHRRGVHHLDLHDKNVMVDPMQRSLKIIDFGLSCGRGCAEPCPPGPDWADHDEQCGFPSLVTHMTMHFDTRTPNPTSARRLRMIDLYFVGGLAHLWWFAFKPYMDGRQQPMKPFEWVYFIGAKAQDEYPPSLGGPGPELPFAVMRYLLCNVQTTTTECARGETVDLPVELTTLTDDLWQN